MNGTVSKRPRKDGKPSWAYVFDAGRDEAGKRVQLSKSGFTTKRQAEDELRKAITNFEAKRDAKPVPVLPTFATFFETWMSQRASRKCEKKTLERYRELGAYAIRRLGETELDKLEPLEIQKTVNALQDAGGAKSAAFPNGRPLSAKTVRHIGFLVHGCLQTAVKWGVLNTNPMDRVELPAAVKSKPHVLDRQKMQTLLSAADGTRLFALIMLAAATGCRRGELLALTWSDVHFDTGILSVTKSLEETKEGLRIKSTKSGEPRRISVPKQALEALLAHKVEQDGDRALFGQDYFQGNLVFCRPDGGFYKPDKISVRVTELATKAGLSGAGLHSLRHSHASELLSKGAPIPTVSKRLGHANANVTLAIYSHALEADELAAAQIWDTAMEDVISKNRHKPKRTLANVSAKPGKSLKIVENKDSSLVEAAGVEPASEIARDEMTTCVAAFRIFRNGLETGKITVP